MLSREQLHKLRDVPIKDAKAEELKNIEDCKIDRSAPVSIRFTDYLEQIQNPYLYVSNGYTVKLHFSQAGKTLDTALQNIMTSPILTPLQE